MKMLTESSPAGAATSGGGLSASTLSASEEPDPLIGAAAHDGTRSNVESQEARSRLVIPSRRNRSHDRLQRSQTVLAWVHGGRSAPQLGSAPRVDLHRVAVLRVPRDRAHAIERRLHRP